MLRHHGCAEASVVQGIAGFGASARIRTGSILRLSMDLPIIVEVVDEEAKIQEVLPLMDEMIGGGLVTLEKVHVVLYRADFRSRLVPAFEGAARMRCASQPFRETV